MEDSSITEVFAIIMVIISIVGLFVMIVYLRKFQNTERMAMIEKGVDPAVFTKKQRGGTSGALRASLLLVGAGVGLLFGYLLESSTGMEAPLPYFSMLVIFGGLGLGTAYLVEEKKIKEEQKRG